VKVEPEAGVAVKVTAAVPLANAVEQVVLQAMLVIPPWAAA
jgi:hypothetical protein